MKVAILTQPLGHNYGGMLQAYALQTYLKKLGCEVVTIDRKKPEKNIVKSAKNNTLNFLRHCLSKQTQSFVFEHLYKFSVLKNLHQFRDQNITLSPLCNTEHKVFKHFEENTYDLIIVGSDQVWRPKYSPSIMNYFLDFLEKTESNSTCISYAASFGVDEWEFTDEQTEACKKLIKKFDAITVRESSAVNLCKNYFDVDAEKVVDPTMLLDATDYEKLISLDSSISFEGKVLSYVLDPKEDKQKIANTVSSILGKETFYLKTEKELTHVNQNEIDYCRYPEVELWLSAFKDASYVVTDSFHGCVFCILFNKPFIAIGNASRGLARFESLLSMFGLEERLVLSAIEITESKINVNIDWSKVNQLRKAHSEKGKTFLQKYVKKANEG